MALQLRKPRLLRADRSSKTKVPDGSSIADEAIVDPYGLDVRYAWIGDTVEIGSLVVGATSKQRPEESTRWERFFSRREGNPFDVVKANEPRGPIRGVALFKTVRIDWVTSVPQLWEMYIVPPGHLGETDKLQYTRQVWDRMLGFMGLDLAHLAVLPLPHDPQTPQDWPFGRPE